MRQSNWQSNALGMIGLQERLVESGLVQSVQSVPSFLTQLVWSGSVGVPPFGTHPFLFLSAISLKMIGLIGLIGLRQ
jgi:hypothetical protein